MRRAVLWLLSALSPALLSCNSEVSCGYVEAAREALATLKTAVDAIAEAGMADPSRTPICSQLFDDLIGVAARHVPEEHHSSWFDEQAVQCNEGTTYADGKEWPYSQISCYRRPPWLSLMVRDVQSEIGDDFTESDVDSLYALFEQAEDKIALLCSPSAPGTMHVIKIDGGGETRELDDYEYAVYSHNHSLFWADGMDPEWEGNLWYKWRCVGNACGGYAVSVGKRPDPAEVIAGAKAFFDGSGGGPSPSAVFEEKVGAYCPASAP